MSPASLVFSPDNWDTPQSVSVTAATDTDARDETATVTLSAEGNRTSDGTANPYMGVTGSVSVEIVDGSDSLPPGLEVFLWDDYAWVEGGSVRLGVRLLGEPSGDFVDLEVEIPSAHTSKFSGTIQDQVILRREWTTDTAVFNWIIEEDTNTTDDVATVIVNASHGNYDGISTSITQTIHDNDDDDDDDGSGKKIVVEPLNLSDTLTEGGTAARYSVMLTQIPSDEVTVTVTSGDTGAAVIRGSNTLTFSSNSSTWSQPQTFTLAPVDDDDNLDEEVTLSFTAEGGGYDSVTATETVRVREDTGEGLDFSFDVDKFLLPSQYADAVFNTSERPTGPVTFTLATSNSGDNGINWYGATGSSTISSVTFQPSDYSSGTRGGKAVRVRAGALSGTRYSTLTATANGGGFDNLRKYFRIRVADGSQAEVVVQPASQTDSQLTESGAGVEYRVGVRCEAISNCGNNATVTVTSTDTGAVTVDTDPNTAGNQNTLTFNHSSEFLTDSVSHYKTVVISPVDDADTDHENVNVTFIASAGGNSPVNTKRWDARVTVTDDDVEEEADLDFSFALNGFLTQGEKIEATLDTSAPPSGPVTFTLETSDSGATGANWKSLVANNTISSFIFLPRYYDDPNGTGVATVVIEAGSSSQGRSVTLTAKANGGGFNNLTKTFTINIPSTAGGEISLLVEPVDTSAAQLAESGSSADYRVKFDCTFTDTNVCRPSGNVDVTVTSPDTGAVTVDTDSGTAGNQSTLTFTPLRDEIRCGEDLLRLPGCR